MMQSIKNTYNHTQTSNPKMPTLLFMIVLLIESLFLFNSMSIHVRQGTADDMEFKTNVEQNNNKSTYMLIPGCVIFIIKKQQIPLRRFQKTR